MPEVPASAEMGSFAGRPAFDALGDRAFRQELLAELARGRVGFGPLDEPALNGHLRSPTCGDEFTVQLRVAPNVRGLLEIQDIGWQGRGCEISVASVCLLSSILPGSLTPEFPTLLARFRSIVRTGELPETPYADGRLDDAVAFAGLGLLPLRGTCALLPWNAAELALS